MFEEGKTKRVNPLPRRSLKCKRIVNANLFAMFELMALLLLLFYLLHIFFFSPHNLWQYIQQILGVETMSRKRAKLSYTVEECT